MSKDTVAQVATMKEQAAPISRRHAIRGVLFNWFGQGSDAVISFLMTPFLILTLGDESYGIWGMLMSLTSYYGLFELGLRNAGIKYLAEYFATGNREGARRIMSTSLVVTGFLGTLLLLASWVVAWLAPQILTLSAEQTNNVRLTILVVGGSVAITVAASLFTVILTALKRFDLINAVGVSTSLINAGLIFVSLQAGGGLLGLGCCILFTNILAQVLVAGLAMWHVEVPRPWQLRLDWPATSQMLSFSLLDLAISAAKLMTAHAGVLIVGVIAGPAAVAIYSIANSLTHRLRKLAKAVVSVTMPMASQLEAQQRTSQLREMLTVVTRLLTGIASVILMTFIVFGQSFVTLWISSDYTASVYPLIVLLLIGRSVSMATSGFQAGLLGMGKLKQLSSLAIWEGGAVLLLGPPLTWMFGVTGMAWTVLLTQMIITGVALPWAACRQLQAHPRDLLLQVLPPAALVMSIVGATSLLILRAAPPASMWMLLFEMAVVGLIGFASVGAICLDGPVRADILRVLLGKRRTLSTIRPGSSPAA